MRRLKVNTSLCAMQPQDQSGVKLLYDQVCEMVAGAGCDGNAIDQEASDVAVAHAVRPLMQRVGLTPRIVAFPRTIERLDGRLLMARDFGATFVDVIGQVIALAIDDMVPVIQPWMAMAERVGVPVEPETYGACITNDLYVTLQLLDRIPGMRICAASPATSRSSGNLPFRSSRNG